MDDYDGAVKAIKAPFVFKTKQKKSFYCFFILCRKSYEILAKKFELFKVECENELYEQMNEQFQKCLNEKLDDVILFSNN